MTWTNFPVSAITWNFDTPSPSTGNATAASTTNIKSDAASLLKIVKVSDIAERGFCQECGSPLTIRYFCEPDVMSVAAAAINDEWEGKAIHRKEIFLEQRAAWWKGLDPQAQDRLEGFSPSFKVCSVL